MDVRQVDAFSAGHIPGALSNAWRAQFVVWLGWLVGRIRPVVVADDSVDRQDLVWAALTVGFEHLVGELAGGMDAWEAATPLVDAAAADGRQVVDIRQRNEFSSGHAPGAHHVELAAWRSRSVRCPTGRCWSTAATASGPCPPRACSSPPAIATSPCWPAGRRSNSRAFIQHHLLASRTR